MGKKKNEKAKNVINVLKENLVSLHEKSIDSSIYVTLENTVNEISKLEKEITILSENISDEKVLLKQKKEELLKIIKSAKSFIKINLKEGKGKGKGKKKLTEKELNEVSE